MNCPLCGARAAGAWASDDRRAYHRCPCCDLIFVPPTSHISTSEEKALYDYHENNESDPRYREYLSKVTDLMVPFLRTGERGLDFGAGPTTVLASLLGEKGLVVDSYDLYYRPDARIWDRSYDFIVLSEVIEHLRAPGETMRSLGKLLEPRGRLFIKTAFGPESPEEFRRWYYRNDPTHISFFNQKSLRALGQDLGLPGFKNLGRDLRLIGVED
jgi:SAM-dependent methyltransferase